MRRFERKDVGLTAEYFGVHIVIMCSVLCFYYGLQFCVSVQISQSLNQPNSNVFVLILLDNFK